MKIRIHCKAGTHPHPATMMALYSERCVENALPIMAKAVSCEGLEGYGNSLAELWEQGETFVNLEQDVAPWPGALSEMCRCAEPWCALPTVIIYKVQIWNICCVKFSSEFIKEYPDIWKDRPPRWDALDVHLFRKVAPRTPHVHNPPALHCNTSHLVPLFSVQTEPGVVGSIQEVQLGE